MVKWCYWWWKRLDGGVSAIKDFDKPLPILITFKWFVCKLQNHIVSLLKPHRRDFAIICHLDVKHVCSIGFPFCLCFKWCVGFIFSSNLFCNPIIILSWSWQYRNSVCIIFTCLFFKTKLKSFITARFWPILIWITVLAYNVHGIKSDTKFIFFNNITSIRALCILWIKLMFIIRDFPGIVYAFAICKFDPIVAVNFMFLSSSYCNDWCHGGELHLLNKYEIKE